MRRSLPLSLSNSLPPRHPLSTPSITLCTLCTLCLYTLCLCTLSGCAITEEDPTLRCEVTSSPTSGTIAQDILGPWLSHNHQILLTFSPNGRWDERPLLGLSPDPSPTTSGTYLTSATTLTLRTPSNQRREHIQVLPDRLIVWISDDANAPLTYWRARCDPSPLPLPGAPP